MFDSVVDFVTQAASSSAFIFCFCNLIIVIILLDLKPSSKFDPESEIPVSTDRNTGMSDKQAASNSKNLADAEVEQVSNAKEEAALVENIVTEGNHIKICSNEEEEEMEQQEEEEEDNDDDELRRRVEEFIEKVNKRWKERIINHIQFGIVRTMD